MNRYFNRDRDWSFDMQSLSDIYMVLECGDCGEYQILNLNFDPVQFDFRFDFLLTPRPLTPFAGEAIIFICQSSIFRFFKISEYCPDVQKLLVVFC